MKFAFSIAFFLAAALISSLIWDSIQIQLLASRQEREAYDRLEKLHGAKYRGIITDSVWVDVGGLKDLSFPSRSESTFKKQRTVSAPCSNCAFDAGNAVIIDSGFGRNHFSGGRIDIITSMGGFSNYVGQVMFSAVCERERKIFGGGCRSVVSIAIGYGEISDTY